MPFTNIRSLARNHLKGKLKKILVTHTHVFMYTHVFYILRLISRLNTRINRQVPSLIRSSILSNFLAANLRNRGASGAATGAPSFLYSLLWIALHECVRVPAGRSFPFSPRVTYLTISDRTRSRTMAAGKLLSLC